MNNNTHNIFLGLNWKMNPASMDEVKTLLSAYQNYLYARPKNTIIAVFVPDIYIDQVQMEIQSKQLDLMVGSQDISIAPRTGAFTGQVSGYMLQKKNVPYVLVGHSENRRYHHQTDYDISQKVANAFLHDIQPVVCFGDNGAYPDINMIDYTLLQKQLKAICEPNLTYILEKGIYLAYEPLWAIGTGVNATPQHIQNMVEYVKSYLEKIGGESLVEVSKILYGGSVNDENIDEYSSLSIDGYLVGGASLNAQALSRMLEKLTY
jgi:triosephosphate isomerase